MSGYIHMRDQIAVSADDDVTADDAVGTDRRAFADHSAVLNSRGGIDRAHRMVSDLWRGLAQIVRFFSG
jgi:hypothetical protein